MQSVNEIIVDRTIRHALFLERLKTHQVNILVRMFNKDLEPKLVAVLEKRLAALGKKTKKFKALTMAIAKLNQDCFDRYLQQHMREMDRFALQEAKWQAGMMNSVMPIQVDFIVPPPQTLKSIITASPMRGAFVKEWFDELGRNTALKVQREIRLGMIEGESIDQIVRRIKGTQAAGYADGILDESRRHLRTLVRTSVSNVSNNVRDTVYAANDDIIGGVQIVATLDARTTEICMAQDGKVYSVGQGWRPPGHHQCRTTTVPVLKSWKQLGIKLKEAPPGTRASMNGQVSARMTYPQWLRKQPVSVQDEALGKGKARLFRRGVVRIDRFVDRRNRPLNLGQLEKLEASLN